MEPSSMPDLSHKRQGYAAALFQEILQLILESPSDETMVRILVAMGDLYRMRTFPPPPQLEEWKRRLKPNEVSGAIACALGHGPQGLFIHPEVVSLQADVDISILNRDRLQSFLIALTRITMHRVSLIQGSQVGQLEPLRETFDTWLGETIYSLRLSLLEIEAKRGDRVLIESQPAWVTYVCFTKRPVNPNGGKP